MIPVLRQYLAPYRGRIAIVVALVAIGAFGTLYLPELNAQIINDGVAKGDTDAVLHIGGTMLIVSLLLMVAAGIAAWHSAYVAMGFGRDLRSAIFRTIETFGRPELDRFTTASLITRTTNDVQQVQQLVLTALAMMISAPILTAGGLVMALRQDIPLSGILLVIIPIMVALIAFVMRRAIPRFTLMQQQLDRLNLVLRETLAGIRVIRAFVRTDHEAARFDAASRDLTATGLSVNRLFAFTMPALMLIMNLSSVAVLAIGSLRVDAGEMPIGNLIAFLQYIMQILFAIMFAVMLLVMIPRAAVSAGRIREVLETTPAVTDPPRPVAPPRGGRIELRDVEFRYPGAEEPVLRGITFSAGPGETTAIVGSTGSGKTTLVNLLPRLYDVTGGSVLVDGADVREMDRADLWRRIGVVPQQAFLFGGTVASNLRVGDEAATDDALWRALEIAQGRAFVEQMEGGLDAAIAQGGTTVSGGQRQRLAIARALVHQPDIYIFDDSFSALDLRTDALLRAALARELAGATVLIVAQRVGTIIHADRIVVLDEGRIVGIGTHGELMAGCPTYREIVLSQVTEEEAAA